MEQRNISKMRPMTNHLAHGASLALLMCAALTLSSGCRLRHGAWNSQPQKSTPQPYPRYDDPDALIFNDLPVKLYFFTQVPPKNTKLLRPVKVRATSARGKTCRDAAFIGLTRLQQLAIRHKANAVVNVRVTWEESQLGDGLTYSCIDIGGQNTLVLEGALAQIPHSTKDEQPAEADDSSVRLRNLQRLYYQGLITHDEFLKQREQILNEL